MLDFYFTSEVRKRQLRHGPLKEHLDGLAAELQKICYAGLTARHLLSAVGQFNNYMKVVGLEVKDVDEAVVAKFIDEVLVSDGLRQQTNRALHQLLVYLRERDIVPLAPPPPPHPFAPVLEDFDCYLRDVRGLASSTRRHANHQARVFIDWLRERYDQQALDHLSGPDILEFITVRVPHYNSRSGRAHVGAHLRSFLRYLYASGKIANDLVRVVPRVSTPRLASLPQGLSWEEARSLIDSIDTTHPDGIRDKAMMLLLATLGLRSGEVCGLEFSEIDWQGAQVQLRKTKVRRERVLPLTHQVGTALADYVLHGRPAVDTPQIFLRHGPRPGPMTNNAVVWIIRRHLQRAGLQRARGGAHMLRHSLATHMVNAGVPIKSVADVLGHASIDTTAVYSKVDIKTLAEVALPYPGGEQ